MSFKKTSLMIASVVCFFVFLMTVSAGSAMAASKIAYVCVPGAANPEREEICIMNPDGSGSTQLTDFQGGIAGEIFLGAWSPDGLKIAFGFISEGTTIYVMDSDGSNLVAISPAIPSSSSSVSWSPELPASVASISPFGQFVIVFLLGGASALWMTKRRQASPLTTT